MWLACHTQEEIAAELKEPLGSIKRLLGNGEDDLVRKVLEHQTNQISASHATDFEVPLYNIWKQQEKTAGSKHFGNSEVRWLDNLLYLYTEPFDVVVDPFAGGGSSISGLHATRKRRSVKRQALPEKPWTMRSRV